MPNIIKSNYVSVIEDNIKVIDSNLKDFQPMNFKKVHQLEGSEENSLDGLDNDEELFQINHELNGSDNLHHMQSMAERILEEAKLEAAKIKEDALVSVASEIESLKQEAMQQGYNDGYEAGMHDIEIEKSNLLQLQQQQEVDYENRLIDLQGNVTEILVAYVAKITGVIIEEKDIINYLVSEAIRGQSSCNEYRIRVSKEDYQEVFEHINDYKAYLKSTAEVSVSEDMDLMKNQCLIETDKNIIDCSIETKINNLVTALKLLSID